MAMGIGLIGGAVSAIGSIMSGNAQSAYYTYQAQVARMNANIATQNAAYETQLGEVQAEQKGLGIRAQISQTRAAQGAGGLDLQSGTNAQVRESEQQIGMFDQSMIRYNAARRAYGEQIQSLGYQTQAQLDTMAASTSKTAGELGAFTSVLGAAGSFSSKWLQGQQVGMFGGTSGGVSGLLSGGMAPLLGG